MKSLKERLMEKLEEKKDVEECDNCTCCIRLMSPRDDGWMDDAKMKAVCIPKQKIIIDGLETYEIKGIKRPSWCPKI